LGKKCLSVKKELAVYYQREVRSCIKGEYGGGRGGRILRRGLTTELSPKLPSYSLRQENESYG